MQEFDISVVVVGRDGLQSILPILECLAEQTVARRMQILAVLPHRQIPSEDALAAFTSVGQIRFVGVDKIENRGIAAASGVRMATAPILAFTENHCFPENDWAERLIEAHEEGAGGVAPAVLNANPETLLSWTSYAGGYAAFGPDKPPGNISELPIHNVSYRRSLLKQYENDLEYLLTDERRLQEKLRMGGYKFVFCPEARTHHINEATLQLVFAINEVNGRRYGCARSQNWSLFRKILYAGAFPLLSYNVLLNTISRLRPFKIRPDFSVKFLALLWIQALAHAFGEARGYLFGCPDDFTFLHDEEFMIKERLSTVPLTNAMVARFVARAVPLTRRVGKAI